MSTRIRFLAAAVFAIIASATTAHAQSLTEIFESVLNEAVHAPIPGAIAPLITAAENADAIAVAALEIAAGLRDRQIKTEYASASRARQRQLDRMEKANEEIKGRLAGLKAKRCADAKKAKDDGWDPFHARMSAGGPVTVPGTYLFRALDDGFADLQGDVPTGPICAIVTPGFTGYEPRDVHVSACSMLVTFVPTMQPSQFVVQVQNFGLRLDSFEIAPGMPTGPNAGGLSPFGSPPRGEYNALSRQFEIRFEGTFHNNLYPPGAAPMMFFATAFGGLDTALGEALVGADDPMIVPMPPGLSPLQEPKVMGAHIIEYDAGSRILRFLENTTLAPDADLAMIRRASGVYLADPVLDQVIGATLTIGPLVYSGTTALGVHQFGSASLRIQRGVQVLLQATLANVELDPNCGDLFGDVQMPVFGGGSQVLGEIAVSPSPKSMQFCSTPGGFDLVALTNGFSQSGRMPWPEIFHLGVLPPAVSGTNPDAAGQPSLSVATVDNGRGPVRIVYTVSQPNTPVRLEAFDVGGRLVRTLEHAVRDPGEYVRIWDRRDQRGGHVLRGVYFVRLDVGSAQLSEKVVLVRE